MKCRVDTLARGIGGDTGRAERRRRRQLRQHVTNRMPRPSRVDSAAAYPLMNRIVAFAQA